MVIDYRKLAVELMREFNEQHPEDVVTDEMETPDKIADYLHRYLDTEALTEFSPTTVGRGILLGFVSACFLFESMGAVSFEDDQESIEEKKSAPQEH